MDYLKYSIFVCFQANDGNWPILKQSSTPVIKPPQISNTDWKESSMDTALKQGTISSQPLPTSVLGSTDKLVGFICDISIDLFYWNYEPLASIAELTSVTYTFSFPADDYLKTHNYLCIPPVPFCSYHITIYSLVFCSGFFSFFFNFSSSYSFLFFYISGLPFCLPLLLLIIPPPPPSYFSNSDLHCSFSWCRLSLFQCSFSNKNLTKSLNPSLSTSTGVVYLHCCSSTLWIL